MPRYFFDVHDGDMKRDNDGIQCSDLGEVEKHAKNLHGRAIARGMQSSEGRLECRVFVRNSDDAIIYMCTFSYSGAWINACYRSNSGPQFDRRCSDDGFPAAARLEQLFTPGR